MISSNLFVDIVFVLAVIGGAVRLFMWRWSIGRRATKAGATASDSSEIIAYYTAGHELMNAARKTLHGKSDLRYSAYFTGPRSPASGDAYVEESAVIYALDLPFNTQTHLVGVSKSFGLDRLQFDAFLRSNGMQKVTLEGDFPDLFDLYASSPAGFQVQYVLDPDAMAFVADYCKSHFWEINASELYFVYTKATTSGNDALQSAQAFAEHIKPALLPGMPGAAAVHHEVPYGEYDGPSLNCPICKTTMELHDNTWFSCVSGHGALLNGSDLSKLHNHQLTITADASKTAEHGLLACPNCQHQMEQVQYEEGVLQIDYCPNCIYRWLDAAELAKLSLRSL